MGGRVGEGGWEERRRRRVEGKKGEVIGRWSESESWLQDYTYAGLRTMFCGISA